MIQRTKDERKKGMTGVATCTCAEETALSSIFEEKYKYELETIARNNRYFR